MDTVAPRAVTAERQLKGAAICAWTLSVGMVANAMRPPVKRLRGHVMCYVQVNITVSMQVLTRFMQTLFRRPCVGGVYHS